MDSKPKQDKRRGAAEAAWTSNFFNGDPLCEMKPSHSWATLITKMRLDWSLEGSGSKVDDFSKKIDADAHDSE